MKWPNSDSYSIPTLLALGLHGVIIVSGLVAVNFSDNETQEPKRPVIVNATVIDISQTIIGKRESEERAAKQQQAALAEKKKKDAEQSIKKEVQRKALEEKERKLAQAKKIEEKNTAEALKKEQAKKREAEKKRLAQEAEAKRLSQENEKKRLAKEVEEKRLAQEAEKKRQAQKTADEQKKKEQARKIEAERLAAEERKRQEEAARQVEQRKAAEAAAKAAAEQRAAEEAEMVQSISDLINSRVTQAWSRPPSARNGMKTKLRIDFFPTGEISNVQVTEGSGDALFDQRTVDAVYKVKRIEELADIDSITFERNFRKIDLIFNPKDLRN